WRWQRRSRACDARSPVTSPSSGRACSRSRSNRWAGSTTIVRSTRSARTSRCATWTCCRPSARAAFASAVRSGNSDAMSPPAGGRPNQNVVATAGAPAAFFDNNGYALATGRFFTEGEARSGMSVVVIGADMADVLFPNESPLDSSLFVRGHRFRVIGTLARRGDQLGGSLDNIVVTPIAAWMPIFGSQRSLNVTVQARDPARIARAQDEVTALLRRARGVAPEAENDFEMFSNASLQDTFDKLTGIVAAASIGICAIALLIGGI